KSLLLCLGATTCGAPVLDWAKSWHKSAPARHSEPTILLGSVTRLLSHVLPLMQARAHQCVPTSPIFVGQLITR
ncbi:hypothetical protein A2U01_0082338, partial [Trifolium medium]|nr:hypothetical protein [Trifolium medium]